ncbi:MAG: ABC transporter ATP-binding protein [Mycobacteriaceae bacterium]
MTITQHHAGATAAETGLVLEVSDLAVSFPAEDGRVTAVRGISYTVAPGQVLAIVGESGSGKSVSSMAVMGLLPPQARITGSVRYRGRELLGLGDREMSKVRGKNIAMVFQDPLSALTPVYSVGDQVAEALLVHGDMSKRAAKDRAVELLDLVGIPNARARASSFPHEFSGGMRQRVVIAMAIANDPDLIIADEPTTALDVTVQAQVLEALKKAQEVTGAGIVMITHDLGVVAGFADEVMVMYAGRAVEKAPVDELYAHPRMPYTLGLLGSIPKMDTGPKQPLVPIRGNPPVMVNLAPGCPFAPRCPLVIDACLADEPELREVADHHSAACIRAEDLEKVGADAAAVFEVDELMTSELAQLPREQRTEVLRVEGLVKTFAVSKGVVLRRRVGSVHAVDGVSFDLRQGETLGVVGESGCGKSTTLLQILDLIPPESGSLEVLGRQVGELNRRQRYETRRDVAVVFQDPMASLDPRLPVSDIIAEPMKIHGVSADKIRARVPELLELVGLRPEQGGRYPAEFSGGQRQRIGIARALALEPKLVVLDEPVSALDVSIQAGVINLLDDLKTKLELSYLFVAHDLSVVRHIADRVAVMYLGKVVEIGDVETVFRAPQHPYTQALLSAIPVPDPPRERSRERILLTGDLPNPANPPSGCRFRTRCPKFANELSTTEQQLCIDVEPLRESKAADHEVACHYAAVKQVI